MRQHLRFSGIPIALWQAGLAPTTARFEERTPPPIRPVQMPARGSFWLPQASQDSQRYGRNTDTARNSYSSEFDSIGTTSAESKPESSVAYGNQKLFKPKEAYSCERDRCAILLIGITGGGKSSTANTLCGAQRAFKHSATVTSVTSSASARDYSFGNNKYRVVDTPGLADTNRSQDDCLEEIRAAARHAPHGFACVFVVVPRMRLTAEQAYAVQMAMEMLGSDVLPFTVMVVTHCTDPREKLLDEINGLPRSHGLRKLARMLDDRVIPVENVKQPATQTSRHLMHKAIVEICEMNKDERLVLNSAGKIRDTSLDEVSWRMRFKTCTSTWNDEGNELVIRCRFE